MKASSIHIGLDRVNPAGHGGWLGECLGATKDARQAQRMCLKAGLACGTLLLDGDATVFGIKSAVTTQAYSTDPGGLLIVSFSGHAEQMRDTSGDEVDQLDEALDCFDQPWLDDDIWRFLCSLPAIRLVLISDCCHAGGVPRGRPRRMARFTLNARRRPALPLVLKATVLHLAACRESESALGSAKGGDWTMAICAAYEQGQHRGWHWLLGHKAHTWRTLFDHAKDRIPTKRQTPALEEFNGSFQKFRALR